MLLEDSSCFLGIHQKMKLTLILVRHGETDANKNRIIQGQAEWPLNDLGTRQAGAAGRLMKDVLFDQVYTSDLGRAKQTCTNILEANQSSQEMTEDVLLRERSFGVFDNRPVTELEELAKKKGLSSWSFATDGGESPKQFQERIHNFYKLLKSKVNTIISERTTSTSTSSRDRTCNMDDKSWIREYSSSDDNICILLVTHGGWILQFLQYLHSLSGHESAKKLSKGDIGKFSNCCVNVLQVPLFLSENIWSFQDNHTNFVAVNYDEHVRPVDPPWT